MKNLFISFLTVVLVWPFQLMATTVITTTCDDYGSCKTVYSATAQPSLKQYAISDAKLYAKYKGRLIMAVENAGEAYYVSPLRPVLYYLGNMDTALRVLQAQGIGVSNANIARVKVGVLDMYGLDSDSDGLSNNFEVAIGTNVRNFNTDGDVYSDYTEIINGYNPLSLGRLPISAKYTSTLKGRVLLQTQRSGEAWYVNPTDGKRYYLATKYDANDLIRRLAVGISNDGFAKMIR